MNKKISDTAGKLKTYALGHKIISVLIAAAIVAGGYKAVETAQTGSQATLYTLSSVASSTIITTVTGSGQISANEQVAVASKVSGALTSLPVTDGQEVTQGQLLATIDNTDAARSLQSAEISLAKLEEAPATTTLVADQNNVVSSYNSAWNDLVTTFINLPTVITGIDGMLNKQGQYLSDSDSQYFNMTAESLRNEALASDATADADYQSSVALYSTLTRQSATASIESLLASTYTTVQAVAQAIKDERTTAEFVEANTPSSAQSQATTALDNLDTWSTQVSGYVTALLGDENGITQANNTLEALISGADSLDIQSQELSIQAAEETYNDYFIYAPIDGILSLAVEPTNTISSGETIGTIVSKQKIATILLNEIDAAKVEVGDKATLTFDAINNLSIAGHVSDVSVIGTVSSGVVSYTITITLDTDDVRIKPGMSVNASIVTDVESNVLTVPNSAIKTQGSVSYVQELNQKVSAAQAAAGVTSSTGPKNVPVIVGVSNSTVTEILSGLSQGDQVITKTTASAGATPVASTLAAPSIFGAAGGGARGGGGGAGAVRIP